MPDNHAYSYNVMQKKMLHEIKFLSLLGVATFVYPFIGRSKIVLGCYSFIYLLVLLTATQLIITLYLKDFSDWVEIINVVPNLAVVLMAVLKYSKVHHNQRFYKKLFDHFRNDLWDAVSDCEQHRKIVTKYTDISRYVTRFLFYYSVVLVIFVFSFPRFIMYLQKIITGEECHLYPFDGWYPFDKVSWYYVAYIWECFMTFVVVCIYGFAGIFTSAITIFICMELKVLGSSIQMLISPSDAAKLTKSPNDKKIHQDIRKRLRSIIIRHQVLAKLSADFDGVLGDIMLINYVFSSVFITLTIFTATVVENLYMRMRYFFMFCSLMVEVFQQCMIGQILSNHSEELSESTYFADWTYADNNTKIMLLILMTRTQRPFEYTANNYLAMNLQSFSSICSMSYQFFNLLYTAYN
nr:odorant receptor 52 [Conogethes punctiferalis]